MLSSSPPAADHVKGLSLDKVGVEVGSRGRIVISDYCSSSHERAQHQAHWRRYIQVRTDAREQGRGRGYRHSLVHPFGPRPHELQHSTAPSVGVQGAGGGVGLQYRGRPVAVGGPFAKPRPGLAVLLHTPHTVR